MVLRTPGSYIARITFGVLLLTSLFGVAVSTAGAVPALPIATTPAYRATLLATGTADKVTSTPSTVLKQACFTTKAEKEQAVQSWSLRASSLSLLPRLWVDVDRGGSVQEFYSDSGCGGYYAYYDLTATGFNDVASSAEPYCGRTFYLYEDAYLGGAVRYMDAYISNLGALNDRVSSWETAN